METPMKFRVFGSDYMSSPFTLFDLQAGKIQFTTGLPVMQSTGEKDRAGTEMFLHDVVEYVDRLYLIEWENGTFIFRKENSDGKSGGPKHPIAKLNREQMTVIGNLYQSPTYIVSLFKRARL